MRRITKSCLCTTTQISHLALRVLSEPSDLKARRLSATPYNSAFKRNEEIVTRNGIWYAAR